MRRSQWSTQPAPGATWFVPGSALQAAIASAAVGHVVVAEVPGWPSPDGGAPFDPGLESQSGNGDEGVTSLLGNHIPVFSSVQFDCVALAADTPCTPLLNGYLLAT